jgi:drug/metabolite transporter (DMT)-like permease
MNEKIINQNEKDNNKNSTLLTLSKNTEFKKSEIFIKIRSIQGYLYNLLGNLMSCIAFFIFKHYTNTRGVPAETLMSFRGGFISIYALIYILIDFKNLNKFDINYMKPLILRSSVNAVGMMIVIYALQNLRVSTCELILRVGNVMSVFMGYFILNEKVTIYDIYGLISTSIGVILILKPVFIFGEGPPGEDKFIGVVLAFICAFLISFGVVITKKVLEKIHLIYTIFSMGVVGCLFSIMFGQYKGVNISVEFSDLVGIALTIFIEFCAILLNFTSLQYEPIVKLAPFYNSRIIYAVILVYFISGNIDFLDIFGVILIVATYVYISIQKIKIIQSINK